MQAKEHAMHNECLKTESKTNVLIDK